MYRMTLFAFPSQVGSRYYGSWCLELEDKNTAKVYVGVTSRPGGAAPEPGTIVPVLMAPAESKSATVAFQDFGYVEGPMECGAAKHALFLLQVGKPYGQAGISYSPPPGTYAATANIQFDSYPNYPNMRDEVRDAAAAIENGPVPLWKGGKVIRTNPVGINIGSATPPETHRRPTI